MHRASWRSGGSKWYGAEPCKVDLGASPGKGTFVGGSCASGVHEGAQRDGRLFFVGRARDSDSTVRCIARIGASCRSHAARTVTSDDGNSPCVGSSRTNCNEYSVRARSPLQVVSGAQGRKKLVEERKKGRRTELPADCTRQCELLS